MPRRTGSVRCHPRSSTARRTKAPSGWAPLALVLALASCGCAPGAAPPARSVPSGSPPALSLQDAVELDEISGLAASRRHDDRYWLHEDSGNAAVLFAFDDRGARVGQARIKGARNVDWEDMASFVLDGRPYLAVADVGDNGAVRASVELVVVEEPELEADRPVVTLEPAWTVRFRYAGGPRDSEAVAVDAERGVFFLMTKRRVPAELHVVPLRPAGGGEQVATLAGIVSGIAQPALIDRLLGSFARRYAGQVTGMDMDEGGRAVVLTYGGAYLFRRLGAEDWVEAFAREPAPLPFSFLPLAEAVAFDRRGRVLTILSERSSVILRVPLD